MHEYSPIFRGQLIKNENANLDARDVLKKIKFCIVPFQGINKITCETEKKVFNFY